MKESAALDPEKLAREYLKTCTGSWSGIDTDKEALARAVLSHTEQLKALEKALSDIKNALGVPEDCPLDKLPQIITAALEETRGCFSLAFATAERITVLLAALGEAQNALNRANCYGVPGYNDECNCYRCRALKSVSAALKDPKS